jgi:hypothetical protein
MSLPDPLEVRTRIEAVQRKDIRFLLKALYLLGAARISEMVGKLCPGDSAGKRRPIIYGPKGKDATRAEYQVQELSLANAVQILNRTMKIENAFPKIPVALFRIKIAKQHLTLGEEPKSRLVALPLDSSYEPWTKQLYDYFEQAGNDYVFPFTRQESWHYITYEQPVFKGLTYPIEKYAVRKNGEVIRTVLPHNKPFKLHALRHLRNKELFEIFHFDGLDFAAYVGWSTRTARSFDPNIPQQMPRYATVYENWQRYFPKFLKRRNIIVA